MVEVSRRVLTSCLEALRAQAQPVTELNEKRVLTRAVAYKADSSR
jgi:hypothetical protein